jgi:hypothetical protein
MWDDEKPKPIGAIDHDGWTYVYYGPHYDRLAALNGAPFNFAQAANAAIQNPQVANTATAPTHPPNHVPNNTGTNNSNSGTD